MTTNSTRIPSSTAVDLPALTPAPLASSARHRGLVAGVLVPVLVASALAVSLMLAIWRPRGDFWATLPGGYAQTLNPVLWDSPDLRGSWAFHKNTYLHGPSQYLTLYPIVFLDSYRQIAWVLLPIYSVVLCLAYRTLLATAMLLTSARQVRQLVLVTLVLFVPALQAFVHREFEVVILLALAIALWLLLRDRRTAAAAVLSYVAWFKYLPLMFVGYLGLRWWPKAVAAFVLGSVVILAAAHAAFGLENFTNNNVPETAAHATTLTRDGFCAQWTPGDETLASMRQGLCRLQAQLEVPLARDAYVTLCALVAFVYLAAHSRLARRQRDWTAERWRRALEFSIVTTVYSCFFFGHYYYLSALAVPFLVLLARNLVLGDVRRWLAWGVAYSLISASVLPMMLVAVIGGTDPWHVYMQTALYLYGEILLIGILLWEYWSLGAASATTPQIRVAHS